LPNFLWLVRHNFISYDFLHSIHVRDVRQGRADGFFPAQIRICVNLVAAPVCLIGLYGYLRGNRYRMLSWMYLVPLFIFFFAKGRGYYVAGLYPMLLAMGSTLGERWLARLPKIGRRAVEAIYFAGLAAVGAYIFAVILPIQSSGPLRDFALDKNGDLREEIGWPELVKTVAGIRDSLPADQQANLGIVVGNYGEQGSIELLGPAYHLPPPISLTNSAWLRGYPTPQPSTLIVVGVGSDWIDRIFTGCRLAGRDGNSEGIKNEESQDHPNIYVCGSPRLPWPEFWKKYQSYG
jgi:hypothetical protein